MNPPPIPSPRGKSLRLALTMNLVLPGTGQLYLGQIGWGLFYITGFLACFVTMMVVFFRVYRQYLQLATGGGILEGNHLEQLADAIPVKLLLVILVLAIGLAGGSLISLAFTMGKTGPKPPA